MSRSDVRGDHPIDALPDYVRGGAVETGSIERHLAGCESCRVELEVLRAVHGSGPAALSDMERQRAYRSFEARRTAPDSSGSRWLWSTWRAAAAIALLLTGVGVWQVVDRGERVSDWSPELALDGWTADLVELDIGPGAVGLAFGYDTADEMLWEDLEGVDPYDLTAPWEDN